MNRAYAVLDIKSMDDDLRIIEGVASTPTADRMGDIVDPMGAKFSLPMPLLWQHQASKPIGEVYFAKATKAGIPFKARIAKTDEPGTLKDRLDEAWQSIKLGLVRAVSIGFKSLKYSIMDDGGYEFSEWEWLELSAVTIPANAEATITSIRSFDLEQRAASGRALEVEHHPAGASARKKQPIVKAKEATPMAKKTIAEQISAFEATRATKAARMQELMEACAEKGETLSAEAQQEYDDTLAEIESIDGHLKRLGEMQRLNLVQAIKVAGTSEAEALAARAGASAGGHQAARIVVKNPEKLEPGIKFARYVRAMAVSRGNRSDAIEFARSNERWMAETPDLIDIIKTSVTAGNTTDTTWAAPLVNYQVMTSEFAEYLRPLTIIGRIPGLRRVPFNVKVQRQTGGSTVAWVGEGAPKPMTSLAFDTVSLTYSKIAGIIALTDELVKLSSPAADQIVRDDLAKAIVQYMDSAFVDPTKSAVTGVSPASVTNGVTGQIASGATASALRSDLITLVNTFVSNNLALSDAVFIMSQQQAFAISLMVSSLGTALFPQINVNGGTLVGIPVVTSEGVPATGGSPTDGGLIILAKASEILLADDGQVTIDASKEASLQMETAPDSPATASTTFVSMFQQNMIAIRAERYINWAKRRSTAVSFIQNAKYTG